MKTKELAGNLHSRLRVLSAASAAGSLYECVVERSFGRAVALALMAADLHPVPVECVESPRYRAIPASGA
jgi:hypothetical protein